jgi:hypothetical protein
MSDNSILDGFAFEADFARDNRVSRRTVANYRSEPNGLPFTVFGGKIWIPIEEARAWLKARVRRPNPRRAA